MVVRWRLIALLLVIALAPVSVGAQSRQESQILQDMRILQEQVQQLRLAVAALAEQTKAAIAKVDSQTELLRTNYANESQTLGNVQKDVGAMVERLNLYSQQVGRLGAEIPAIRQGLDQHQKTLEQILARVDVPSPTPTANTLSGTPPAPGTPLPPSPSAAFTHAKGIYAAGLDYELAAKSFEDFLQRFPDAIGSGYGGEASYLMGMSYFRLGRNSAALAAFTSVIEKYATSESAPDAWFQRAECYRVLGDTKKAQDGYMQTFKQFPDTTAGMRAKQMLVAMGIVIK